MKAKSIIHLGIILSIVSAPYTSPLIKEAIKNKKEGDKNIACYGEEKKADLESYSNYLFNIRHSAKKVYDAIGLPENNFENDPKDSMDKASISIRQNRVEFVVESEFKRDVLMREGITNRDYATTNCKIVYDEDGAIMEADVKYYGPGEENPSTHLQKTFCFKYITGGELKNHKIDDVLMSVRTDERVIDGKPSNRTYTEKSPKDFDHHLLYETLRSVYSVCWEAEFSKLVQIALNK